TIRTGDAEATGNESRTDVRQDVSTGGSGSGAAGHDGTAIVDQSSKVFNTGYAEAETGENHAVGHDSENLGLVGQLSATLPVLILGPNGPGPNGPVEVFDAALVPDGHGGDATTVASNDGEATNWSD